jgi:hypothetical protein
MKLILPLVLTAVCFVPLASPRIDAQLPKSSLIQFVDITAAAGIKWNIKTLVPGPKYLIETMGGGGGFIDYNGDGLLDIYLVCYSQNPQPDGNSMLRDVLYRNNGDGTFTDVTQSAGISNSMRGMGLTVGDYDNDGWPDIYITGFGASKLYHNNSNGTFTDVAEHAGVNNSQWGTSAAFFDYDNDGLVDLFVLDGHPFEHINKIFPHVTYSEPPFLFENTGKGFREVAAEHGAPLKKFYSGRGLAVGDFDNDGDSDLLLINVGEPPALLRNDGGNRNHWLGIALTGTTSNRDGIGAKVTVTAGGRRRTKQRLGGGSYCSASDPRLLFGLGSSALIDEVEVKWPSGQISTLKNVSANQYLRIKESPMKSKRPLR